MSPPPPHTLPEVFQNAGGKSLNKTRVFIWAVLILGSVGFFKELATALTVELFGWKLIGIFFNPHVSVNGFWKTSWIWMYTSFYEPLHATLLNRILVISSGSIAETIIFGVILWYMVRRKDVFSYVERIITSFLLLYVILFGIYEVITMTL
jgi:hypothetical protein